MCLLTSFSISREPMSRISSRALSLPVLRRWREKWMPLGCKVGEARLACGLSGPWRHQGEWGWMTFQADPSETDLRPPVGSIQGLSVGGMCVGQDGAVVAFVWRLWILQSGCPCDSTERSLSTDPTSGPLLTFFHPFLSFEPSQQPLRSTPGSSRYEAWPERVHRAAVRQMAQGLCQVCGRYCGC